MARPHAHAGPITFAGNSRWLLRALGAVILTLGLTAFSAACNRPFHLWEAHTTATPLPPSLDLFALAREPVVALIPATYNHLQGYIPSLSQALAVACSETTPSLHLLPQYEVFNKVNHGDVVHEYIERFPSFSASGLLDPDRLKSIGQALGVKYVLQPGLAYVTEDMDDKFEAFGFHILRTRINTIGLWLRLWDAQTGEFLAEAAGEATVAAELLDEGAAVPFHEFARKLWRNMIQEGLLSGKTTSRSFLKNALPFE